MFGGQFMVLLSILWVVCIKYERCVKICQFLVKFGQFLVSGWSVFGDTLWLRTFYTLFLHKFHTFSGGSAWVYISEGGKNRQNLTTHFWHFCAHTEKHTFWPKFTPVWTEIHPCYDRDSLWPRFHGKWPPWLPPTPALKSYMFPRRVDSILIWARFTPPLWATDSRFWDSDSPYI